MSFKNLSPWEEVLFKNIDMPSNVTIPVDDEHAYLVYSNLRWMFNKMELCKTQDIKCAPIGVKPEPDQYPVFMKPIINLYGMGMGAKRIDEESDATNKPGFFWMEYLEPPHISTDVIFDCGKPVWWGHNVAHKIDDTRFEMWEYRGDTSMGLVEEYITKWVKDHIGNHTGAFNFETMNGKIIDAHLRFSVQFVDLYGEGWLQAVADLYSGKGWNYDGTSEIGYSVPIWSNDFIELQMSESKFEALCAEVLSIQITIEDYYQPTTGYRIAVVNGHDKEKVYEVVNSIKKNLDGKDSSWWDKFKIHRRFIEIEELIPVPESLPPKED